MWPWGHLAVGYLLYSALSRTRFRRTPPAEPVIALALGTQFPDLLDKPLAWTFGILPSGRSVFHSVLAFVVLSAIALAVAKRYDRHSLGVAFAVGYGSHLLADAVLPAWQGDFDALAFLAYPFVSVSPDRAGIGIVGMLSNVELTPFFWFQLALVVLAFGVWVRDGAPPLVAIRRVLPRSAP